MTERKLRKLILGSVPFETDRLIVRYINNNDVYDMYEYASVPEVSKYLLWEPHVNIAATEGYIESLQKRYYRGLYADWAIELKGENKMIGTIGYANINSKDKSCEIGYVLSPKYRKQGYMTEALSALLQITFEGLKFYKAILRIIDENSDSVKLAEKMGFTVETSIEIPIKGQLKNVLYYTKTKNEAVV